MKLIIFSVFDEKSGAFGTPFFCPAIGQALRLFGDLAVDDKTSVGRHPEDYKLYEVGAWLDDCAKFQSCEQPKFLGHATDFVPKTEQNLALPFTGRKNG